MRNVLTGGPQEPISHLPYLDAITFMNATSGDKYYDYRAIKVKTQAQGTFVGPYRTRRTAAR